MNLVFFGPPGSGKGTYAAKVSEKLQIPKISTGDILRAEISADTKIGKKIVRYLKAGELAPDNIVIDVVKSRLKNCKNGFILDGFPRTIEQMRALEKIAKIDLVVNFNMPKIILIKKLTARRTCEKCGAIYNIADIKEKGIHLPPLLPKRYGICDKCGGKLIKRKDDTISVIKERLKVYEKESKPLIKYYKKRGILKTVDVIGPPDVMVPVIIDVIKKNV